MLARIGDTPKTGTPIDSPVTYHTLESNTGAADADSDPLTFLITQVQSGTLTKKASGSNSFDPVTEGTTTVASGDTLQWVPASDAVAGTDTYAFVVKAFDGHLYSEPVSVHTVL